MLLVDFFYYILNLASVSLRIVIDFLKAPRIKSFQDHKVFEVTPEKVEQIAVLESFEANPDIVFWTPRSSISQPIDIMVSPSFQAAFQAILDANEVEYKILIDDVEAVVSSERMCQRSVPELVGGTITFQKYLRYSEIQDYLNRLVIEYSDIVQLEHCGYSYEKQDIILVRISTSLREESVKKTAIFIDAGIHAREWITPAQALYIIHQLVENPDNKDLIKNIDWFIIPLLNPDGYEYTHTDDRFWRKTRSKGRRCHGVDANRNFDFHWMEMGSSKNECSCIYGGPLPFSEPETIALRKAIERHADQIKLYLTLHSAAQCLLYPWGYTYELPDNSKELHNLAVNVEKAICSVNGRSYKVGSSTRILRASSGSSRDWVIGVAGIKLSYTVELPGGGRNGFDLPAGEILDVVTEIFEGIKEFHRYIEEKFC